MSAVDSVRAMVRTSPVLLALLVVCGGCRHDAPTPAPESGGVPLPRRPRRSSTPTTTARRSSWRPAHLVLELASNSGTGYAWTAAPVDSTVLASEGQPEVERQSDLPGGPKLDVLHFVARGAGTVALQVDLKRPWGDAPAAKTIKVTVNVR